MDGNGRRALWVSLAVTGLSAAVLLWTFLFEYLMNPQGVYLRSGVKFYAGTANLLLILPTSVFVSLMILLFCLKKRRAQGRGVFTGLMISGSVLYGLFLLWAAGTALVLGAVSVMRGDYVGEDGWLKEWHGPWDDAQGAWYTYFEEYNWLWKKEYFATQESVQNEMEEKYGIQITPSELTVGQEGWGVYIFAAEGEPAFDFRVQPSDQRTFQDDFAQACADAVMENVLLAEYPERKWSIAAEGTGGSPDNENGQFETALVIGCEDAEDARACAEIVARLAEQALQAKYVSEGGALIVVRCRGVERWAADQIFTVGRNRHGDRPEYVWEDDRYTDWSLVYARLLNAYTWNQAADDREDAGDDLPDLESSTFYVEGAYRALYDVLFAGAGYPYKPDYNAKGNFCAYLTEGTGMLESAEERMNTVETVVYDRESANGKCHLFVHYRDYYEVGTQSPYSTEIVDMYAVDMATGQVWISGRHAWADVGDAGYREATGEP